MNRKRLFQVAIALCLGMVTSIAVAWTIAASRPVPMYPRTLGRAFVQWDRPWHLAEVRAFGAVDIWWSDLWLSYPTAESTQKLVDDQRTAIAGLVQKRDWFTVRNTPPTWGTFDQADPPKEPNMIGSDTAFGWPALCLWYQIGGTSVANTLTNEDLRFGWLAHGSLSSRGRDFIALPYNPLWPGLILNTLVYAAIWMVLLIAPSALRRSHRRRCGRCIRCGYDLKGNLDSGCSECGWHRKLE